MDGRLEQRLASHKVIGLDTSIFIYHFEANQRYHPLTETILKRVESRACVGVASMLALMELTVQPWRKNRGDVARQYEVMLINFPNLRLVEVTREVARRSAQLRAKYGIRPADALQIATAMVSGATAWISNDKKLRRLEEEIGVVILEDYVGG